jgi:hypothetical protein
MSLKIVYILLFAMGLNGVVNAQLNDYKYIIVPKKFDAFKSVNQYQSSTLIKYYFEQNGFNAVYNDDLPFDLAANRCLGLTVDFIDNSNMFTTKAVIALKDCNNAEVFRSEEVKSKIKSFEEAYKDVIQQAFLSYMGLDYAYEPQQGQPTETAPVTVSFKDDVKTVDNEPKTNVVEQKATMEEQVYKTVEPKPTTITKGSNKDVVVTAVPNSSLLYAQPTETGYQLVDSTPKVVLKLEETSMENVFMTNFEGNNAVVFKKGDTWLLEYSDNGEKVQKELNIKF